MTKATTPRPPIVEVPPEGPSPEARRALHEGLGLWLGQLRRAKAEMYAAGVDEKLADARVPGARRR